jgi:D-alanine-D-alanine ligase
MPEEKINVAILFGGKSVEHDISLKSAQNIFMNIDKEKYDITLIGIDRKGGWHLQDDTSIVKGSADIALLTKSGTAQIMDLNTSEKKKIDVVFPVLHGTDGEDGSIQGLLQALNIPFVGTGVLGSAISMNKIVSKRLLDAAGIPVTRYLTADYGGKEALSFTDITEKLGLPFIVKPANLGSSVGISKVSEEGDFEKAMDTAFKYDQEVIIEEFVTGRELECAVMGDEQPVASDPGEILIKGDYAFYDFEAKYVDPEAVEINIPAKVEEHKKTEIKQYCVEAYKILGCNDFARVDLFYTPDGKIYINEINTIPGFTNSSMFPMLWANEGINYTELITKLIEMALTRHEKKERTETSFDSGLS